MPNPDIKKTAIDYKFEEYGYIKYIEETKPINGIEVLSVIYSKIDILDPARFDFIPKNDNKTYAAVYTIEVFADAYNYFFNSYGEVICREDSNVHFDVLHNIQNKVLDIVATKGDELVEIYNATHKKKYKLEDGNVIRFPAQENTNSEEE